MAEDKKAVFKAPHESIQIIHKRGDVTTIVDIPVVTAVGLDFEYADPPRVPDLSYAAFIAEPDLQAIVLTVRPLKNENGNYYTAISKRDKVSEELSHEDGR